MIVNSESKEIKSALRRAGMNFLARREHSFNELELKLRIKFPHYQRSKINEVVTTLRNEDLQSDKRFVESYCRYRKYKGFGYKHIRNTLDFKRVSNDEIDKQLFPDDPEWIDIATIVLRKKIKNKNLAVMEKSEVHKLTRFMENRGFTISQIKGALKLL